MATSGLSNRRAHIGQRTDHHVLELHVAGVALQADMALTPPPIVGWNCVGRNGLAVERYLDGRAGCLDLEGVPLAGGFGCERRGWRQPINGTGLMQRTEVLAGVDVEAHVIDLDLVTLIGCELPIIAGIARIERRKTKQDAGIVGAAAGYV